jgi:hypothetical protein
MPSADWLMTGLLVALALAVARTAVRERALMYAVAALTLLLTLGLWLTLDGDPVFLAQAVLQFVSLTVIMISLAVGRAALRVRLLERIVDRVEPDPDGQLHRLSKQRSSTRTSDSENSESTTT